MNDSANICDEVIDAVAKQSLKDNNDETKTIPTIFNEKKLPFKAQNVYILLAFLLITRRLLIVVNIYCYLVKY